MTIPRLQNAYRELERDSNRPKLRLNTPKQILSSIWRFERTRHALRASCCFGVSATSRPDDCVEQETGSTYALMELWLIIKQLK